MPQQYVIVIGGPTGVGKTQAAISLAQQLQTEIINADSRQVFKELVIGVGRPTPEQLQRVNHHLIGHKSIFDSYSAGQYAEDATLALAIIFKKSPFAILCGGTGLYLKSIMHGLDAFPPIPQTITDKWTIQYQNGGIEALASAIRLADPEYADLVDMQNPMRLIRALAVTEHTGLPYSSFRTGEKQQRDYIFIPIQLELPRDELYARINQRVIDMINAGWYQEAEALYPHKSLKALQTVGYQELFEVIEGKRTINDAIRAIQQSTRHYAKRQLTWFRNQGAWKRFRPDDVKNMIAYINSCML